MLRIVIAMLLGLGIVFTLLALMDRSQPGPPAAEAPTEASADYWMSDARVERFGPDGERIAWVDADRMTHFPDDGRTELDTVTARRDVSPSLNWWMRADAGFISGDRSVIRLRGDARLERRLPAGPTTELESDQLNFFPDEDRIQTDEAVVMQRGPTVTTGIGMTAHLGTDRMQIDNDVRTHHADRPSR